LTHRNGHEEGEDSNQLDEGQCSRFSPVPYIHSMMPT
jgi:hypothetical protein